MPDIAANPHSEQILDDRRPQVRFGLTESYEKAQREKSGEQGYLLSVSGDPALMDDRVIPSRPPEAPRSSRHFRTRFVKRSRDVAKGVRCDAAAGKDLMAAKDPFSRKVVRLAIDRPNRYRHGNASNSSSFCESEESRPGRLTGCCQRREQPQGKRTGAAWAEGPERPLGARLSRRRIASNSSSPSGARTDPLAAH